MLTNQSGAMASHLPAAASFHNPPEISTARCAYGQSASQLNGVDNSSGVPSQTGDALGKALASVCISFSHCLCSMLVNCNIQK